MPGPRPGRLRPEEGGHRRASRGVVRRTAHLLIECAHRIERKGGNPRNLTLHGQEKNLGTRAICKMNMLRHGLSDARIEKGDTIRDPRLVSEGELLLYDRVIANRPFSLDEWGRDVAEKDGYGRFRFGVPPKTKGDLAFGQHMVAVLNGAGVFRNSVFRNCPIRNLVTARIAS